MIAQDITMDKDFDIMEVCSACLSKNPSHWLINNTADAYTDLTGIKLTDDLPNQMCDSCIKLLNQADDFRTKCLESYEWLIKVRKQINNQNSENQIEQETDRNNIIIKEEVISEDENILPEIIDRNKFLETDIHLRSIKEEIVVEEEMLLSEETAVNEQLFTIKTESLDSDMKVDTSGVKDLDSCELHPKINKTIPLNNNLDKIENIKEKDINRPVKSLKEKPYKCDRCFYKSSRLGYLVKHIRTHASEKLHKCYICQFSTTRENKLLLHLSIHTGEKLYKCNTCPYFARKKHSLVKHLRTHTGEKPVTCDICCKKFARKSYLVQHLRTHTGEKPYKCNTCNYRTSHRSNLLQHVKTHSVKILYKCDKCNYSSIIKASLVRHLRFHKVDSCKQKLKLAQNSRKTGEKPFECDIVKVLQINGTWHYRRTK